MPSSAAQCVGWRRHGLAPSFIAWPGSDSPRGATLVAVVVSPHVCRSPVALPAARVLSDGAVAILPCLVSVVRFGYWWIEASSVTLAARRVSGPGGR